MGIGVLLLILAQTLEITLETSGGDRPLPSDVDSPSTSDTPPSTIPAPVTNEDLERGLELPEPIAAASPSTATPSPSPDNPGNATIPARHGSLRVSNQTIHPVRVALLPQRQRIALNSDGTSGAIADAHAPENPSESSQESLDASSPIESASSTYRDPVHWDFVPGEGAARGLVLGLPDADLVVQPGDVITAFAQDGSQRYWGPYVAGDTDFPRWNPETDEWVLILRVNDNLE